MIYTGLDNFYLTDEQLVNPPSVKDGGLDAATEFNLRVYGATLVQEGGLLLKSCAPSLPFATLRYRRAERCQISSGSS
jgi:hypothetical protein